MSPPSYERNSPSLHQPLTANSSEASPDQSIPKFLVCAPRPVPLPRSSPSHRHLRQEALPVCHLGTRPQQEKNAQGTNGVLRLFKDVRSQCHQGCLGSPVCLLPEPSPCVAFAGVQVCSVLNTSGLSSARGLFLCLDTVSRPVSFSVRACS